MLKVFDVNKKEDITKLHLKRKYTSSDHLLIPISQSLCWSWYFKESAFFKFMGTVLRGGE